MSEARGDMAAAGEPEDRPGREEGFARSGAQEYFRRIEDHFLALRGSPLLLSPKDWKVAERWHREGVPLDLVRRVLDELFAARAERGARGKVSSLAYCARAVDAAWERVRSLAAAGERDEAEPLDLAARLESLAASLPAELPERERWAERVRGAAGAGGGDPGAVETELERLDGELLAALEEALGPAEREALEAEVETAVARLAGRLAGPEIERARSDLARRLLRRRRGLPVLSLFAPEAAGPGAEG